MLFSPGGASGIKDRTNDASQPEAEAAGRNDGQPNAARWQRLDALWEETHRGRLPFRCPRAVADLRSRGNGTAFVANPTPRDGSGWTRCCWKKHTGGGYPSGFWCPRALADQTQIVCASSCVNLRASKKLCPGALLAFLARVRRQTGFWQVPGRGPVPSGIAVNGGFHR